MNDSELSGPRYWKSLDDLAETPAFRDWVEREFPAGASELDGVNRRQFMKVMAASFGLAGLGMTGCRRPEHVILPYSQQPENVIPGVPIYFSSSRPGARENMPVIVETHTGRPTKIEGNPSYHPYGGATDVYTQAGILDLYDPDRLTKSRRQGAVAAPAAVRDALTDVRERHLKDGGKGLVFLAEPSTSPSRAALAARLRESFPEALWSEYSPLEYKAAEAAAERAFGKRMRVLPKLEAADRVLSLDADFLSNESGRLGQARAFAKRRKVKDADEADRMSRLYCVESGLSSTGSMADHRLRLGSSQMGALAAAVALAMMERKGLNGGSGAYGPLAGRLERAAATLSVDPRWVEACAADLLAHPGKSLVLAGDHLPESVHTIVIALNQILGAPGATLDYAELPGAEAAGIAAATERLESGAVETLFILGGNPVFDAPADLEWGKAQAKAGETLHCSYAFNETAAAADILIARSHYLECWGDGRTFDGTLVPVQPMIEPLFATFNELEILARLAGSAVTDPHAIARETFAAVGGSDYSKFLSDGLLRDSAFPVANAEAAPAKLAEGIDGAGLKAPELTASQLEVRFVPSYHAYDGSYANNGWMMECPDPISKLTWDNAILISPRLAKELEQSQGIPIFAGSTMMNKKGGFFEAAKGTLQKNSAPYERGQQEAVMAELEVDGRTVKGPIHVLPGLANYSVLLPVGMGRTQVGRVGTGVGFDFYGLRRMDAMGCAVGAAIRLTRETYRLANTQEHWSMEGRAIVREGTTDYYKKHPGFANEMGVESHAPPNYGKYDDKSLQEKSLNQYRGGSAYEHPEFDGPPPNVDIWKGKENLLPRVQQWGMAIDLNSCTGCSACVVACQGENNIPIVGKDQVLRGREMHWMRLDRYFSAASYEPSEVPEEVQVSFMGMLCQHCENAPCESVCPVNATVHDRQGLNVMAYNRCVGTRYCANNCPYKVRRFNFFDWNKRQIGEFYKGPLGPVDEPELEKMKANPDVTVRMRGVMEKCTYCTQRIEAAKIDAKHKAGASNDYHVADGRIRTACQQVCPTDAISFGDISDPDSEVSKMKASDRNYSVLGYLNVRPRTTYLARLRNPNPQMPDAYDKPYAYQAYKDRYGSGGAKDAAHPGGTHPADTGAETAH